MAIGTGARFTLYFITVVCGSLVLVFCFFFDSDKLAFVAYIQLATAKIDLQLDKVVTRNFSKTVDTTWHNSSAAKSYLKVNDELYLYSAIQIVEQNSTGGDAITVSGWQWGPKPYLKAMTFSCCFLLSNGSVAQRESVNKRLSDYPPDNPNGDNLNAVQYHCPVSKDFKAIRGICITQRSRQCYADLRYYLVPVKIHKQNKLTLAVCSKLNYGALNASRLLEWFEAAKLVGIDHVIAYKHNINANATKVLEYYQSKGFLTVLDFNDLPAKDRYPREAGQKTNAAFTDEQVVIFDCQERMRAYSMAGFLDTDEFIIPEAESPTLKDFLKNYLERKFSKTSVSGVLLPTKYHVTSWPSKTDNPLFIGQHITTTGEMKDTTKYFYKPTRIKQGSCAAHNFESKEGFHKLFPLHDHEQHPVVHHFRLPRTRWLKSHDILRQHYSYQNELFEYRYDTPFVDFKRYICRNTQLLAGTLQRDVLDIRTKLGIHD